MYLLDPLGPGVVHAEYILFIVHALRGYMGPHSGTGPFCQFSMKRDQPRFEKGPLSQTGPLGLHGTSDGVALELVSAWSGPP